MKDNEIIRALECCSALDKDCQKCLYNETFGNICIHLLCKDTLDLINRQKAEIERLTHNLEAMAVTMSNSARATKAEAYKEAFAKINEIITEIYNKHIFGFNDLEAEEKDAIINFSDDITYKLNNLVKEMVGENNDW